MKTFDYAHAWMITARPAWLEISAVPAVRQLFDMVKGRSDLQQDRTLNVPIPSSEFETIAATVDTLTLAKAAHAAYFYGHWAPSLPTEAGDGSGWKFSNILDQIISKRLGMRGPHETEGPGLSFRCIEGVIRAQFSYEDGWTWHEISYATDTLYPELLHSALWDRSALIETKRDRRARQDARLRNFEETCKVFKLQTRSGLDRPWDVLLNTEPFMVEESDVLHLETITPDGTRKERLCGISASLDVTIQILNERPTVDNPGANYLTKKSTQPAHGSVLLIGTYPEGKSYKGAMSVRLATIAGEDATTAQALTRASEYKLKAEIRKAEETVSKSHEALAALKVQGEAMPRTAADEVL